MTEVNFSLFRDNLEDYLDKVEKENSRMRITNRSCKSSVLMSLDEYNSIMETLYLLGTRANAKRLFASIDQMNSAKKKLHGSEDFLK
ncbi:type II toxin-antitoxin system Phd/YefM family antitoxin [Marinoscillum pacificum]|uniref:type II toxin-antitoxin system Phd/YefM family antitoxin n=1 Tax=Marinoscillum pacificum TaxID=392723 RepID=UPI0021570F67|nr:type II toxin-antitoxin system prevent-host-death family antitoxin [Marinoscillum pacificum]